MARKRRARGEGDIYPRHRADGSIQRYEATIELERGTNGKRQRRIILGKTRKEVAEKILALKLAQTQGVDLALEMQTTTVSVFLDKWVEEIVKVSRTMGTHKNYSDAVRLYIKPAIGKIQLAKLKPEHVQTMLNAMFARGLSARTCQLTRAILRKALNQAMHWGHLQRNVATMVEVPRGDKFRATPLNQAEALVLLQAVKGHRLEALYRLELSLGLRKGEVLALKWEDIDFEQRTIRVRASLQTYHGKLHRLEPKTESSVATLPLPDVLAKMLLAHKERQDKERHQPEWQEHDYVFASEVGTPLWPRNVNLSFKRLLKRAKLSTVVRFHDLRHSCATLLIAQGVHISVVKEVLRHSQLSVTADLYGHVLPPTTRKAVDDLDAAFGSGEEHV